MFKKSFAALLSLLLALSLVACSAAASPLPAPGSTPAGTGSSGTPVPELTVCIDAPAGSEALWEAVFDSFERGSRVRVRCEFVPQRAVVGISPEEAADARAAYKQDLADALLSGNGPDIYLLFRFDAGSDLLPDMNGLMQAGAFQEMAHSGAFNGVDARLLAAGQSAGRQYAVPLSFQVSGILLCDTPEQNKALAEQLAGLPLVEFLDVLDEACPTAPPVRGSIRETAVDSLFHEEAAAALPILIRREAALQAAGLAGIHSLSQFAAQGAACDSADGVPFVEGGAGGSLQDIASSLMGGSGALFVPIPDARGNVRAAVSCAAVVTTDCDEPEAAQALVEHLLSEDIQRSEAIAQCGLPVRTALWEERFQRAAGWGGTKGVPLCGDTLASFAALDAQLQPVSFPAYAPDSLFQPFIDCISENRAVRQDEISAVTQALREQLAL